MISGIVLLTSLCFSANPPPAPPDSDTIALVSSLRQPPPADTPYTEIRFVHVLQRPLLLRGYLHYGGVDQLGKQVDTPYRESTVITGTDVTVERAGKPQRKFSLERAPELQGLLSSFTALLGGNATLLNSYYGVILQRNSNQWSLVLTPRLGALAKQLHDMTVDGRDAQTRCFTLHESDGDSSVMLLGALAGAKLPDPLTPKALESLCDRVAY